MERIDSEDSLLERLFDDVENTPRERIVLVAGHFPVSYEQGRAFADTKMWGDFTPYSLELACKVGTYAQSFGKEVGFALIADDINYESVGDNKEFDRHQKSRWRNAFYKDVSGESAELPGEFGKILVPYGFSEQHIIKQDQGKQGREDSLILSERILRDMRKEEGSECAKAYRAFLGTPEYLDKSKDHLVAFIPDRCSSVICSSVLDESPEGLSASHVFMQPEQTLLGSFDKEKVWSGVPGVTGGVFYRKD